MVSILSKKTFVVVGVIVLVVAVLLVFRAFESRKNKDAQGEALETALNEGPFDTILVLVTGGPGTSRFVADLYEKAANPGRVFVSVRAPQSFREELNQTRKGSLGNIVRENVTVIDLSSDGGHLEQLRDSFGKERFIWITPVVSPRPKWDSALVAVAGKQEQRVFTAIAVPSASSSGSSQSPKKIRAHYWTIGGRDGRSLTLKPCVAEPEQPLPNAAAVSIDLMGRSDAIMAAMRLVAARRHKCNGNLTIALLQLIRENQITPFSVRQPLATGARASYRLPPGRVQANPSGLTANPSAAERFSKQGHV